MRIFILLSLLFLTACSSNMKKGDNMMEAEQYDQAVFYYEKALADDPGDEEIAQKLYEARTRMVYAHLIKVRLQRQGNQQRAAATLLNQTLKNIKQWKIIADSGVKATIEEEVMEAGFWLNKELQTLGQQKAHNQYYFHLANYDEILASGLADAANKQYQAAMKTLGQSQCSAMKSMLTPQSHYLYDTWIAYCGVFGVQGKYVLKQDDSRYRSVKVSGSSIKIGKGSGVSRNKIAQQIQNRIDDHLWFNEQGSQYLKLAISGRVKYKKTVRNKTFTRKYKAKEETFEIIKDPKNPKKVIRKLVHSKPVKKQVTFKGKEYTETSSYMLELKGRIGGAYLTAFEQTANSTHQTQSHSTYFKSEGIRPLNPEFMDKTAWMNSMGQDISKQVIKQLDDHWLSTYCEAKHKEKSFAKDEYPARCAQLNSEHPTVNAWTQSQFNLSHDQLQILLTAY